MINWLVGLIPGLVALSTVVLFARGWSLMRAQGDIALTEDEFGPSGSPTRPAADDGLLTRWSLRLAPVIRSIMPRRALRWLQRQVDLAGRPDGLDVDGLLAQVARWAIIVAPGLFVSILNGSLLMVLLGLAVVIVLPLARLAGTARKRREAIDRDLPDFLDVLAVTVTAGLGFRSALAVVAQRFGGPLGEEIQLCLQQIDNGASVRSAFHAMRTRTDSESVGEFVTAYLQAEELGAPLVDTLDHIADDMRRASAQRMRQKASQVEPRVSLLTTTVMVPGAMILLGVGMYYALGADQLGGLFPGTP